MRTLLLAALIGLAPSGGNEPTPTRADAGSEIPRGSFVLTCGELHVGDGSTLRNIAVVVRDGKIAELVPANELSDNARGLPVLDASDKVVMPGIVAADTDLATPRDSQYNVTPDFLALDGFDFVRELRGPLAGGVTSAYLSPGRSRLISGQGAVVKTFGDDLVQRVVGETVALRITLGEESTRAPAVFEPTAEPTSDNPLQPARKQFPSARISQLSELRRLFKEARRAVDTGDAVDPTAPVEFRFAWEPLQRVLDGKLPLRIEAPTAADAQRAMLLADSLRSRLVLENPLDLGRLARRIKRRPANRRPGAVFRLPVRPGAKNAGGEVRTRDQQRKPTARPEDPALAASAGLRIALAPANDGDWRDMLLVAAIAIRHGLDTEAAMRSLTLDAAEMLGVADRVGSIAVGKDADFLVLSGAPFAIGTLVERTYVDGQPAFERKAERGLLAVRAGRMLTMAGRTLRNGVMLIATDGTIRSIGEELAIPQGARVIDLGADAVVVPGFIDGYSHVGLSGPGGVPGGAADQRIHDIVEPDDPLLASAAKAGVTTVLVAGRDGGMVSGRVAALKTAADDRESLVLRDIAAIRMVHDAIGPNAIRALGGAIQRAKPYADKWRKYEEELKGPKPEKKPEAEAKKEADKKDEGDTKEAKPDPVTGTWEGKIEPRPGFALDFKLRLKLAGTKVTGTFGIAFRGREQPGQEISNGTYKNETLTLEFRLGPRTAKLVGKIKGKTLTATVAADGQEPRTITAQKTSDSAGDSKPAAKPSRSKSKTKKKTEGPKKPDVDENLEPLRLLLEKKIPAIVTANRGPAIRDVVKYFADQKLPLVLSGVRDARLAPAETFGADKPTVLLEPDVVRRERGKFINAAARFADRGQSLVFGTAGAAGTRYLPVHAAMAVRYGMDPTAALEALTIQAAKAFKLDDHVGSLERGKHADFVAFNGNPLEMTSRILMVGVSGNIVHDAREEQK